MDLHLNTLGRWIEARYHNLRKETAKLNIYSFLPIAVPALILVIAITALWLGLRYRIQAKEESYKSHRLERQIFDHELFERELLESRDPNFRHLARKYLGHSDWDLAIDRGRPSLSQPRLLLESGHSLRGQDSPISRRMEEIVEEKRNKFLNVPSISFHYANKDQIVSFYNDYFKEPSVASLVSEITGEISGELKGSLPKILESKIGTKDLEKWISTIKLPDISLNGMFLRYQRETIKSGQISLGLEEVEIELTELQAFDEALSDLHERFNFQIDDKLTEQHRANLKEKAAERTLSKLEQATGWVLIEGRFKIESEGEFYKCIYSHPVNNYLSAHLSPITISVLVPIGSIESHIAGNYRQSIGKQIPMRIYGQVWQPIDRAAKIWEFQLTPLALY